MVADIAADEVFEDLGPNVGGFVGLETINELGIVFKDLNTQQSSLEEIFVNLVRSSR